MITAGPTGRERTTIGNKSYRRKRTDERRTQREAWTFSSKFKKKQTRIVRTLMPFQLVMVVVIGGGYVLGIAFVVVAVLVDMAPFLVERNYN